jgi:hypothetical protein
LSEFCSQLHAPNARVSEKHTKDKPFQSFGYSPETVLAAFQKPMRKRRSGVQIEQGPSQAQEYGT